MIVSRNPQINLNRLRTHRHVLETSNVLLFWPCYGWGGSSMGSNRNDGVRTEANPCWIYGGLSILRIAFSWITSGFFLRYQCTSAPRAWVRKQMAPRRRGIW